MKTINVCSQKCVCFIDIYIQCMKHKLPVFLSVLTFYKMDEQFFLLAA
jgi:hypothetical protein